VKFKSVAVSGDFGSPAYMKPALCGPCILVHLDCAFASNCHFSDNTAEFTAVEAPGTDLCVLDVLRWGDPVRALGDSG